MKFDRVAPYYDSLASWVFGIEWRAVQLAPVSALDQCKSVLIVGGGTGQVLAELRVEKITYVEFSSKMMAKAQSRKRLSTVEFIRDDFFTWDTDEKFDAVLMPFFLDLFPATEVRSLLGKVKKLLKSDGRLHVIDFKDAGGFQNALTKVMYLFFRHMAEVPGSKLLDHQALLEEENYQVLDSKEFLKGWVYYGVYRDSLTGLTKHN